MSDMSDWDDLDIHDDEIKPVRNAQPPEAFRGLWIPYPIADMVMSKKIRHVDAYMIATLDRFIGAKDVGCWASDERLGMLMGLTDRQVRSILRRLMDLGLVWKTKHPKYKRLLMTATAKMSMKERKKRQKK